MKPDDVEEWEESYQQSKEQEAIYSLWRSCEEVFQHGESIYEFIGKEDDLVGKQLREEIDQVRNALKLFDAAFPQPHKLPS